jgi:hypothetical protein
MNPEVLRLIQVAIRHKQGTSPAEQGPLLFIPFALWTKRSTSAKQLLRFFCKEKTVRFFSYFGKRRTPVLALGPLGSAFRLGVFACPFYARIGHHVIPLLKGTRIAGWSFLRALFLTLGISCGARPYPFYSHPFPRG